MCQVSAGCWIHRGGRATALPRQLQVGGVARLLHLGETVLSQRWSQLGLGELLREEMLRLKGPVLSLGCG